MTGRPKSPEDPCTPFEERAAILEYCAGMTRTEAERKARIDCESYMARVAEIEQSRQGRLFK